MPRRVQMTRQRPWRQDHPDAVIVARPSRWGNPFPAMTGPNTDKAQARALACGRYRQWLNGCEVCARMIGAAPPTYEEIRASLAGKDLACWCPINGWCHADVLLEIANGSD